MYLDKDDIINLDECKAIENCMICTICDGVVYQPLQCVKCENLFCKNCIEEWRKKSDSCPYKCQNFELKENKIIKNILSNLKFKCKNGCDIQIPYNDLKEHYEEKCPKLDFKSKYESLLEQFNKLQVEYDTLAAKNSEKEDITKIPIQSSISQQIMVAIHLHPLMRVQTRRTGWSCDNCRTEFESKEKSYYCSICDYDLCETCKKMQMKLSSSIINRKPSKCGHQ